MSHFYQFEGFKDGDRVAVHRGHFVSILQLNFILEGSDGEDDQYAQAAVSMVAGDEYPHSILESGPDSMEKFRFGEIDKVA